ncbi:unnamed protein product [Clonostachys rhizophaga]|uniref:Aminoglycoside phosphotransferase domain-containing protein n=1 Tax=Clonostachys rhizophaga TaxID=160324 RepID=A0A9N9YVR6_9HYPO|nr:unnamed protein product [Clonostachys rhizophaga]
MTAPSKDEVYAKVKKGLEATPFEPSKLTQLAGGSVNFTYEAALAKPLDDGAKTVFIKHAEPYMKVRPETALPPDLPEAYVRQTHYRGFESDRLHCITNRTPKYYSFIEDSSTQILEYMTEGTTLKEFIPKYFGHATTPKESDAREIGKTVGSWLKWIHQLTANDAEMHAIAEKNELGRFFRHMVTFTWLKDRVEQYPSVLSDAKEIFREVEQAVTSELSDTSKLQAIHGDFWTGNNTQRRNNVTLFVVDWEMVHLNVPHVDFGLMVAGFYYFWLFKSMPAGRWMMESMVEACGPLTEEFAFRTAIQVGAHLVCVITDLNRVPTDQLEKAAATGKEILVHAGRRIGHGLRIATLPAFSARQSEYKQFNQSLFKANLNGDLV